MADGDDRPLIFVSYSHRDEAAKDFVNRHLKVLQIAGDVDVWDDRRITVGDDWYQEIETQLNASAVAVLLISADFLGSEFCIKEEVSRLLERRKRDGMMIAPILLRPCAWTLFPWLSAIQMQPRDDRPLLELDQFQQDRELTEVVLAIHNYLEERAKLVAAAIVEAEARGYKAEVRGGDNTVVQADGDIVRIHVAAGPKADAAYPPIPDEAVDLTRLPVSGYDVVGRDRELQFVNDALDGTQINVVSLRAWGGVGKSTLVNKWCEYLAADHFRGARRVFGWSFYSQGTGDGRSGTERATSADAFIDAALTFFGDDDPKAGSPWARGERLAGLVGKAKALLILDGMEPLQDKHQGIRDPALTRLVECLAAENAGLCVITTREPVRELADFPETTIEKDLEYLSKEAGRALLRIKGLRGADDLLEMISEAFGNHALALDLLANYLKQVAGGDVRQALTIPDLPDLSIEAGKHPRRVMAMFADHFGEGPELDLLHAMGLFDRPADAGCIDALREPAIPGLTERLSALDEIGWRNLLDKFRRLGLLAKASHHAPGELDAHPLVREHFGARLHAEREEAWKAGHGRLYEHLTHVPDEHRPDSLAEMAPLLQAVHHGCSAGRRHEALEDVYNQRVVRGDEGYLVHKLGAFGTELGLLASFFENQWDQPAKEFSPLLASKLLGRAAFILRAQGALGDAVVAMNAGVKISVEQSDWDTAATGASNLAEVYLALGSIKDALEIGRRAVHLSDLSGDPCRRMTARTNLADILHQGNNTKVSLSVFQDAVRLAPETPFGTSKLFGAWSYKYCDLLISLGVGEKAESQASYASSVFRERKWLLDEALDQLVLGKIASAAGRIDEAANRLTYAVEGLRKAGTLHHLPRGLLARAAFFREVDDGDRARKDLDEAMRLATRCGMRLFACDAHLEYARLALAEDDTDTARSHVTSAEMLVSACGYHRRAPDVAELKEKLVR